MNNQDLRKCPNCGDVADFDSYDCLGANVDKGMMFCSCCGAEVVPIELPVKDNYEVMNFSKRR